MANQESDMQRQISVRRRQVVTGDAIYNDSEWDLVHEDAIERRLAAKAVLPMPRTTPVFSGGFMNESARRRVAGNIFFINYRIFVMTKTIECQSFTRLRYGTT